MAFKCYTCDKKFKNQRAVEQHCGACNHLEAWECGQCKIIFHSEKKLEVHLETDHKKRICSPCNKIFFSVDAYDKHNDAKHALRCAICTTIFYNDDDLRSHISNRHNRFDCTPCDRSFYGKEAYDQHKQAKHSHSCMFCTTDFSNPASLEKHMSEFHNLKCPQCGVFYKHKSDYDSHLMAPSHAEAVRQYTSAARVITSANHATPARLAQAINTPSPQKSRDSAVPKPHFFKCEHCFGRSFGSQNDLLLHQVSVHIIEAVKAKEPATNPQPPQEPPKQTELFACHKCEGKFETAALVVSHKATWHPPTPREPAKPVLFPCEKCSGKFDNMTLLQEHKTRWHMHPCNECFGLFFDDAIALQKHREEYHIFKCLKCPELFFTRHPALSKHEASVHHQLRQDIRNARKYSSVHTSEFGETWGFDTSANSATSIKLDPDSTTQPSPSAENQTYKIPQLCQTDASTQTTTYKCDECTEVYDTYAELKTHLANSPFHKPKPIECYECGTKFQNVLQLHAHMESKLHKYTRGAYCLVEVNREFEKGY